MYKDDITGKPLPVSPKSNQTIVRALVAALNSGAITGYEYAMTYAEICEQGRLPQLFGGLMVDEKQLSEWQHMKSWHNSPTGPVKRHN